MSEQQQLPAFFGRVHQRYLTPHIAIIITGAVMLALTLRGSFVAALTISAIARLVTYAVTCAALPVLRRRAGVAPALFRLPGGPIIAVAALLLAAWLLANSTFAGGGWAVVAAVVGFLVFLAYRFYRTRTLSKSNAGV